MEYTRGAHKGISIRSSFLIKQTSIAWLVFLINGCFVCGYKKWDDLPVFSSSAIIILRFFLITKAEAAWTMPVTCSLECPVAPTSPFHALIVVTAVSKWKPQFSCEQPTVVPGNRCFFLWQLDFECNENEFLKELNFWEQFFFYLSSSNLSSETGRREAKVLGFCDTVYTFFK